MRKPTINRTIRDINEKIAVLTIKKTNLILSKSLELDDTGNREFDARVWAIDDNVNQLKAQKRALMNIMGIL